MAFWGSMFLQECLRDGQQIRFLSFQIWAKSLIVSALQSAKKSVDLVLYQFNDPEIIDTLINLKNKGVAVRVILNKPNLYLSPFETKVNQPTSKNLREHGIDTHFLPDYAYTLTHSKFMIIDNEYAIVQTFNLADFPFKKARNFALSIENKSQVHALSQIFENNYMHKGALNDKAVLKLWKKDHLILGPVHQRKLLGDLLRSAKHSIYIYQQDLSDPEMGAILETLAKQGKKIEILMAPAPFGGLDNNRLNQTIITAAGGEYRFKPKAELYIHAKVILIDPETKGKMYLGSCNLWPEALSRNRELGIVTEDTKPIQAVFNVFKKDWGTASSYDKADIQPPAKKE